ncbi:hypothetical protein ACFOOK_14560 [Micromonospora krabiensis]|uniref:LPXTG-motif cell wall anchor domain-containing protein n=1 Tax=Micromonospora krabiensis TaxID=307121 RepID=A0A1C3N169_9ACTN|nr:hypothetical protein [Micromonospora krabiensis]SBV26342.1 hypothetical protein GA0070620_1830 [Micromonospora krabiensis]
MSWTHRLAATTLLAAGLIGLAATPAAAHDGNVGITEVTVGESGLDYDLYLDPRFLATALPDLRLADATLDVPQADRLLAEGVAVSTGGRPVTASGIRTGKTSTKQLSHLGGVALLTETPLVHIHARYDLGGPATDYRMEYRLFLPDKGQQPHSNLAWIHQGGQTRTFILSPDAAVLTPGVGEVVATTAKGDNGSGSPVALVVATGAAVAVAGGAAVLLRRARRGGDRGPAARRTGRVPTASRR